MGLNVPTVGSNLVRLDPLPRQRMQTADFGQDQVGQGVARLGADVQQFAHDQDQIQVRYDTAAVKDADARVQADLSKIRSTVLASKGIEAVGAKAQARQQIAELRKTYTTSLSTPRQQQMFGDAFSRLEAGDLETYDRHEAKQIDMANTAASEARFTMGYDRAVALARENPEASQQSLADAILELRTVNRGMPPEVLRQKEAETTSKYHVDVANAILDQDGDILAAEKYVKDNSGAILDTDETKWWKGNRDQIEDEHADSYYGEALAVAGGVERTDETAADADQKVVAQANGDPLRGKGKRTVQGGQYGAGRAGGRMHSGQDIPAPAGTPVHAPMSGKVTKVWYDKEGGNSILVEHPDGRVTGYAHLRNVNVEAGDQVDASTVLGGVGNTGAASRGNHLHYTVRDAKGRKVDPSSVSWTENRDTYRAPSTDRVDLQATYRAIDLVAQRNNLSRRQVEKLYARAERDANRNDRLRDRGYEDAADAADAAIDRIESGGGEFTSLSQLGSIAGRLKPSARLQLRGLAERNAKGDALADDSDTFIDLYEMSGNPATQDQFSRMDLKPLRGNLSKGDYNRLRKAQVDIRNGKGTANDVGVDYSRVDTFISRFAPQSAGVSTNTGRQSERDNARIMRARVAATVRSQVAAQQEKLGRKLTDDEMSGIVRSNLAVVYTGEGYRTPTPRGALIGSPTGAAKVVVPLTERSKIVEAWRRQRPNTPITEGDVARIYLANGGGIQ